MEGSVPVWKLDTDYIVDLVGLMTSLQQLLLIEFD